MTAHDQELMDDDRTEPTETDAEMERLESLYFAMLEVEDEQ